MSLVSTGFLSCGTATLSVGETYTSYSSSAVLCSVVEYLIWIGNVTHSQQQISAPVARMTGSLNLSIHAHALGSGDGLICISRIIQEYTLINNTGIHSDQ